jgi:hypothetical protein
MNPTCTKPIEENDLRLLLISHTKHALLELSYLPPPPLHSIARRALGSAVAFIATLSLDLAASTYWHVLLCASMVFKLPSRVQLFDFSC